MGTMSDPGSVSVPRAIAKIDALTGLRLLPAVAVVLSHLQPPRSAGPLAQALLSAGYAGVTVFFVLSGFVLAHNYFERFASGFSPRLWQSYFVARLARVYPLYFLMLVWMSLPDFWKPDAGRTRLWWQHALALQAWSGNLSEVYTYNRPAWSVGVEFFLYACFPLLVPLLVPATRTARRTLLSLAAVLLLMAVTLGYFVLQGYGELPWEDARSAHRWLYRNPACRLGDFLLGLLVARLVALRVGVSRRGTPWLLAAAGGTIVALMAWPSHTFSAPSWDFSYALPASALIFALASAPESLCARAFASRPMLLLGEASYALYLCFHYLLRHLKPSGIPESEWLASTVCTLALLLAVAVGLHVAIERPCRELLRALLDPLSRRQKPAIPVPALAQPTPLAADARG
jgi:peptidoglycan/LPS O-acetylase OafA/YrhL